VLHPFLDAGSAVRARFLGSTVSFERARLCGGVDCGRGGTASSSAESLGAILRILLETRVGSAVAGRFLSSPVALC
jgi:hypothetical protein